MSLTRLIMPALAALCWLSTPAFAQDDPEPAETPDETASTEAEADQPTEEDVDEVIVVIGSQRDRAMAAYQSGDFARAEELFLENATCALRRERNQLAAIESIQRDQVRSEVSGGAAASSDAVTPDGSGGASPNVTSGPTSQPVTVATPRSSSRRTRIAGRTCDQRGFQIYMAALSQLKQGKVDEALAGFERATVLNKVLYDAHFRIGLIKLLRKDKRGARRELAKIETILSRCRRCEARPEIIARRDYLAKAIAGEVELE